MRKGGSNRNLRPLSLFEPPPPPPYSLFLCLEGFFPFLQKKTQHQDAFVNPDPHTYSTHTSSMPCFSQPPIPRHLWNPTRCLSYASPSSPLPLCVRKQMMKDYRLAFRVFQLSLIPLAASARSFSVTRSSILSMTLLMVEMWFASDLSSRNRMIRHRPRSSL